MYFSFKAVLRVFCLAASAFLLLICLALKCDMDRLGYMRRLENTYLRALGEISGDMSSVALNLEKAAYAGTDSRIAELSADISHRAEIARSAMASLPIYDNGMDAACVFLANVRDYTETLRRDGSSAEAGRESLLSMAKCAEALGAGLAGLEKTAYSGEGSIDNYLKEWSLEIPKDGAAFFAKADQSAVQPGGADVISRDEALAVAARLLRVSPKSLSDAGGEDSSATYIFTSGESLIGIKKDGGEASYILSTRKIGEKTASVSVARRLAAEHLREMGLPSLRETFYETANGVCTVTFARLDGGVVFHTDMIKVGVALDDLSVVYYNAGDFITNRMAAYPVTPVIGQEEASAALSPALTVKSSRLAYICNASGEDVLVYEFLCGSANGRGVIVFVNAATASEEGILLIVEDENHYIGI